MDKDVGATGGASASRDSSDNDNDGGVDSDTSDRVSESMAEAGKEALAEEEAAAAEMAATAEKSAKEAQARMEAIGKTAKDALDARIAADLAATVTATPAFAAAPAVATPGMANVVNAQFSPTVPGAPPISLPSPVELGKGLRALSPAGVAIAAAVGLDALNDLASQQRIQEAAAHIGVDLSTVEGAMAARAYAMAGEMTSFPAGAEAFASISGLPVDPEMVTPGGAHRHAMLETIAQIEYDNPGTFDALTSWPTSDEARAARDRAREMVGPQLSATFDAVDMGLTPAEPGALIGAGLTVERVSAVHPGLSTSSSRARGAIVATGAPLPQRWQAHHEVPFNVVASMPVQAQLAIAGAGWTMDNPTNLTALPADLATYRQAPNLSTRPYHSGPHFNYDRMVTGLVAPVAAGHTSMSPAGINAAMITAGDAAMAAITRPSPTAVQFHPRLN